MQSEEIRSRFLKFFEKRNHTIIPSASLVPEHDPSVLFTTAGMQPLVPYLLGEKHPQGTKIANAQKCVRTQDIEEVGDNTHDTFFEMLGNWSLGDYFKEDAIRWSYEFLTSKEEGLGLDPERLYVTVFGGNEDAPKDTESFEIWRSLGVPEHRIYFMTFADDGKKEPNWWSPGDNGPCGPDSEMFYDVKGGLGLKSKEEFIAADERQDVVEIWNDVFMEYEKKDGKVIGKLKQKNVDTGAGLERLCMVMQNTNNVFATDLFASLMEKLNELARNDDEKARRIVADHIRTAVFMIGDGVVPSNTDQGYILRRLLRRAVRYADGLGISAGHLVELAQVVIEKYKNIYPGLLEKSSVIKEEIEKEETKFRKTLEKGLKELSKIVERGRLSEWVSLEDGIAEKFQVLGKELFLLATTYGFPFELSLEEIKQILRSQYAANLLEHDVFGQKFESVLLREFEKEMKEHQELSRKGAEKKFKGGLADHSEQSVKYHTATHLLHQALREVLGPHAVQKGSNITPERLRFDFVHPQKMTPEEIKQVEDLVNKKIQEALPVHYEDIPQEEAEKRGAIGLFEEKYGDKVRVYQIGEGDKKFSLEYCGGPHVKNTSEIGHFRIVKEEAVSAGIRRIKAVAE